MNRAAGLFSFRRREEVPVLDAAKLPSKARQDPTASHYVGSSCGGSFEDHGPILLGDGRGQGGHDRALIRSGREMPDPDGCLPAGFGDLVGDPLELFLVPGVHWERDQTVEDLSGTEAP